MAAADPFPAAAVDAAATVAMAEADPASAAAVVPNWVLLEPFVFRRDKETNQESSYPDETKAPIRATGTTSFGSPFNIAFSLAEPPNISRLYAQLPGFPGPEEEEPLAMLATHRHLALFRVGTTEDGFINQDFFIFDSTSKPYSLQALPPCTEPAVNYLRGDGLLSRRLPGAPAQRRLLALRSMGLFCQREGGEQDRFKFAVAELNLFKRDTKVSADFCLFKSVVGLEDRIGGEWNNVRVPIHYIHGTDDIRQLCFWQTDAVVPVDRWLCWVDYYRGILFCDLFAEPPTVSFHRFPLDKFPDTHNRSDASSWLYRGVSPIHAGHVLKFVDVARSDGIGYGELRYKATFTITCHTLTLPQGSIASKRAIKGMVWIKDGPDVKSSDLWTSDLWANSDIPRQVLMLPQVNIDRPNVVHFLVSSYGYVMLKMWLVAVDMNTKAVEAVTQYINGVEDIGTEDADLTDDRSCCPKPFLSCEFSKYLR